MALETLTTLENALKTYYLAPIIKQLDEGSGPVLAAVEKGSKYIVGNKFKFPLQYGRSGGVGARAEDGDLPTPSARNYAQGEALSKNLYARFSLTDKMIRTSKDNKASFVNQVDEMMNNLVVDGNDMLRRNMVGTSSGVMGQVNANVSSATSFVLKAGTGSINAFYPGQFIDIGTVASSTLTKKVDAGEIVDVDYETGTITLSVAATLAANDYIYLAGNFNNELTGIEDIMTATTIYGINRSTNSWFKPTVYDKSSSGTAQALDSMWIQEAFDGIDARVGEKPNFIVCNYGVQRAFIDEQNTYKRNIEYMKVNGGYDLASYARVPISVEKYMKPGVIDIINTKWLYLGRLSDWDWMDLDGAILHRIANKAAYEGSLVEYAELLCTKPAAHARIIGIAEV